MLPMRLSCLTLQGTFDFFYRLLGDSTDVAQIVKVSELTILGAVSNDLSCICRPYSVHPLKCLSITVVNHRERVVHFVRLVNELSCVVLMRHIRQSMFWI